MEQIRGTGVCNGVAIGKIVFYRKDSSFIRREKVSDVASEKKRYEAAKNSAIDELYRLKEKASEEIGEADAEIFEMHAMLLEDDDYNDAVQNIIETQQVNAEYAVSVTGDHFYEIFSNLDDEYMKSRAADMKHISERVIAELQGIQLGIPSMDEPCILVTEDLQPSETLQMDRTMILSFVTEKGSANSHTAILARTMSIPALAGVEIKAEWNNHIAIVDGNSGDLIIDPDEAMLEKYNQILSDLKDRKELLNTFKGKESVTQSGHRVNLYANIGNLSDLAYVLENDAEGVGLFRSEFIYLDSSDYPTEEYQFEIYKKVAETLGSKKVIIRTLDIGADKKVDYFKLKEEENPALGFRAIRICLTDKEVFKTQLRAIFRASAYGNISVMYPMITSAEEVNQINEIVDEVKAELKKENIPFNENIEQGIMIETPAAALISDELAKLVDFFSIGTNDLSQYTLAIDRQNDELAPFYNPKHRAILSLIDITAKNAHENGIWVGICGELGADTSLTQEFMDMGIDELSVSPGKVLGVRKAIIECS